MKHMSLSGLFKKGGSDMKEKYNDNEKYSDSEKALWVTKYK